MLICHVLFSMPLYLLGFLTIYDCCATFKMLNFYKVILRLIGKFIGVDGRQFVI